jgi:hypothetical protein
MPYTETGVFLAGMVTMGFVMAGAFFIRFWRRAHEDRFLAFALAFWLLAVNQVVSVLRTGATDSGGSYVIRLGAFVLMVAAALRKNKGAGR